MYHIAIMKKSWHLIEKILTGEKVIESRWYQTKRAPWGKVKVGDVIFFKNTGERVVVQAKVDKVLQFEFIGLNDVQKVVNQYGDKICLVEKEIKKWERIPNYAILMFLKEAKTVKAFSVNKKGFGNACAWICVGNINKIKLTE